MIDKKLAADVQSPWGGSGWTSSTVSVDVPLMVKQTKATKKAKAQAAQYERRHGIEDPEAEKTQRQKFHISNIHHRSLLHILWSMVEDNPASKDFHWHGFEEHWQPPDPNMPSEQVYGELYTSEAFLKAERELLSAVADDDLPRVIAAFMFWSDAMHVAQFGQAKMWPIYLFFGNLSKYLCCRPSSNSAHHVAFLPSVKCGIKKSDPLMAHCRRELFHSVWKLLLDDEFIQAMEHGIVMKCADGIVRCVFPRIFTYSADYPEKVLIATIRDMGGCPCPGCTVTKAKIRGVAEARKLIYEQGYAINSEKVENLLKATSLVPTENAFSKRLSQFLFQVFEILVVDQMHEFELGVWKALIIHLVHILNALGQSQVQESNSRHFVRLRRTKSMQSANEAKLGELHAPCLEPRERLLVSRQT
ncbi:hypothetical protein ARMGADRAFT_1046004 [Armillaria gallica]|uniref:Uncharacterized protein n=1 Tax=Armillaria gallica TaxID=47427 RepID=A0A2H3DS88_ARMGA|nr:hypothetical protein ARMGADRAFT_1046004 [Armillaria gallica]